MTTYFSAAAGGFFDDELHSTLPPDALPLTDAEYQALMAAQADGKCVVEIEGTVQAVDPLPPSAQEQLAIIRSRRDRLLDRTDKMVTVPDFPISASQRDEAFAWRALLRDVPDELDPAAPFDTVAWPPPPAWLDDHGRIIAAEDI